MMKRGIADAAVKSSGGVYWGKAASNRHGGIEAYFILTIDIIDKQ